jgi:N-terminal domain of toast_rack, DUF2154
MMNKKKTILQCAGGILAVSLLISSCGLLNNTTSVDETRTETQAVELGSAKEARVQIRMHTGHLSVAGNAASLMDANFRYNVADWQPHVNYSINSGQGELVVDHQGQATPVRGAQINEWNLLLSNAVPINLNIETGTCDTELDLRGLDLTDLQINLGAGTTDVDLSSALDHDLRAEINGGLGDLSVKLPGEMGVQVSADTKIGGLTSSGLVKDGDVYVNDVYGSSPHTLYLVISAGVGSINLLVP